jgi:hypothetical protein
MNLAASTAAELDLVPPADQLCAQITPLRARLIAVADYCSALGQIHDYAETVTEKGLSIQLPNPFKDVPEAAVAVRRAQSRSSEYGAGNMLLFHWTISFVQYAMTFTRYADRLLALQTEVADTGPTTAQRDEALSLFDGLLKPLAADRDRLIAAETAFLHTLKLLEEDRPALGAGSVAMNRVIDQFQQMVTDQMIKYTFNPMTRGLAEIMGTVGNARISHLRAAQKSISTASGACEKAAQEVALLAGSLLTLLGRYQGVEAALKRAEGVAFKKYLGQFNLAVARDTWERLRAFAMASIS